MSDTSIADVLAQSITDYYVPAEPATALNRDSLRRAVAIMRSGVYGSEEPLYCTMDWVKTPPSQRTAGIDGRTKEGKTLKKKIGRTKSNYEGSCGTINHHVCLLIDGHLGRCECDCGSRFAPTAKSLALRDTVTQEEKDFGNTASVADLSTRWKRRGPRLSK